MNRSHLFLLPAGTLHVNVDAANGLLRVAVCDEAGTPINGFEESRPIGSDTTHAVVSRDDAKLEVLTTGRRVRLKLTLDNGRLFSYGFGETE